MDDNTELEFEALSDSLQNAVISGDTPYEVEVEEELGEEWRTSPDQDRPDYILNGKPGYEPWSDDRDPAEIEKEKIFNEAKNNMPVRGKQFIESLSEKSTFELFLDTLPAEERKMVREYAIKHDYLGSPVLEGSLMMLYGSVFTTRDFKAIQRQFRNGLEEEAGHAIGTISRSFSETMKMSEVAFGNMTKDFSTLPEEIRAFVKEVKDSKESFNLNAEKQAKKFDDRLRASYAEIIKVAEKEFRNELMGRIKTDVEEMNDTVSLAIKNLNKKWDSIEAKRLLSTFAVSALGSAVGMGVLLIGLRIMNII
ncbi:TPA: hypothetical protein QDB06_000758 [Burkholderia vietnamiensis]|nr:hypothetical protein [Burkholderia vietnamiensis]